VSYGDPWAAPKRVSVMHHEALSAIVKMVENCQIILFFLLYKCLFLAQTYRANQRMRCIRVRLSGQGNPKQQKKKQQTYLMNEEKLNCNEPDRITD
jgi:hypothetical protein